MKNDELTVRTPLGELVVGIKADPDGGAARAYPLSARAGVQRARARGA